MVVRWTPIVPLLGALCGHLPMAAAGEAMTLSLAGDWGFRLDPGKEGIQGEWFRSSLPDRIRLPGSTDGAGIGTANAREPNLDHLSRLVEYVGPAWYQRDFELPAEGKGKWISLFIERCHWETRSWVDGRPCGVQDSLSTPHVHDLGTSLSPGKHRLTLRVDNSVRHFLGPFASAISEETQTNWNGLIGRIELRGTDPVRFGAVDVYPDVLRNCAAVRLMIVNGTEGAAEGRVILEAVTEGDAAARRVERDFFAAPGEKELTIDLPLGDRPLPWDEFSPALQTIAASLQAKGRGGAYSDARRIRFGLRSLGIAGKLFTLNGRPILLRGTLECCIFPLTGYPAMEEAAWTRIFGICRLHGLNHMRFHSWCPPEAAFAAADQAGFLIQVEAPRANVGADPARDAFIDAEVDRILAAYGNHPSFGMLCMGNELDEDTKAHDGDLVSRCRRKDPRHLYTSSTGWSHVPQNDYDVLQDGRGIHGPGTAHDLKETIAARPLPAVYHEIGQWCVYPNFAEISKYTGVLRPRNLELLRAKLAATGMADLGPKFTAASGQLSLLSYKEEIELMLRTPGIAGFQLLALHDYPGTGMALVGLLDAFWDSKGLTTPEAFRRFCGPTVPLLRMRKRTFTADDTFEATAEVSHFGSGPLVDALVSWKIGDGGGHSVAAGTFDRRSIACGGTTALGPIAVALACAPVPCRLTVSVAIEGTPFANDWSIWVYPGGPSPAPPPDVLVSRGWDKETVEALRDGRKVLLLLLGSGLAKSRKVPGRFTSVFWSPVWFKDQAGPMGILCAPDHPALAGFPTEEHVDWQWYHLLAGSCSIVLDGTPDGYRPIVQVIDDFTRNRKLGNLFEANVGKGRLLACSIDLPALQDRPEGRQLLRSLFGYIASDSFRPAADLDLRALDACFVSPFVPAALAKASLRIEAATRVAPDTAEAWTPRADEVLAREAGFAYEVLGQTWRDSGGAAWFDPLELTVRLTCPRGFAGRLYVHFHDWNDQNRAARLTFQGRPLDPLEAYSGDGVWREIPVTAADSAKGTLELKARAVRGNVVLSQIALVK